MPSPFPPSPPAWRPLRPDEIAPGWFRRATSQEPEVGTVVSGGVRINHLVWGTPGSPGLVFVHGGAAHAHWWSFLVPLLGDTYRVAAMDLSGHGDSDRRDRYRLDDWADEVLAVADAARMAGPPVVVGHSMGGFVTIATAARHGDLLGGAIILDSPVSRPDAELEAARSGTIFGRLRVYPTIEEALSRFRTVPAQERYDPHVADWVARRSIRPTEGGWTWKYDPNIFVPPRSESRELLPAVSCRVALLRAEHGLVTEDIGRYMYDLLGRVAPVVEIPEAGHHLMLDQPLLLLTAIRTLLADWEHSSPVGAPHEVTRRH